MSIKYSLVPNHLTDDPDDYMAVVHGQATRTEEDIINEMLDRRPGPGTYDLEVRARTCAAAAAWE